MAKAKSNSKKITLEDSLVPVEEQPYEVPENWCWVKINSVSNVYTGNSINERVKAEKYEGQLEGVLFIATKDVDFDNSINYGTNVRITDPENFKKAPANTTLLCIEGGSAGKKIGFTNQEVCFGNKLCAFASDKIEPKYIYYFLQSDDFIYQFNDKKHGLIGGVSVKDLGDILFPLPPLSEQQRIVEQIESLFAKLDEAKEKILSVVESFELREKAIYKKAFEGNLTNSWRAENGINISDWEEIPFEKLGKLERGRSKHRPRNDKRLFDGKYPFIQTGDVAGAGMYVISHKQTLSEFGFQQSRMFPKGTLCITIAANIGDAAILSYDCCFPDSVVGFTPGEKCLNKYMYFYLQEIKAELEYIAPATAQKNLNLKLLGKVEIKVPSLKEQEKIVEILEKQINDQENIVEKAENVIETIDVMKKSILAKAFRGELGTNIETEESAIELLKSIL